MINPSRTLARLTLYVALMLLTSTVAFADEAPERLTVATWNIEWYFDSYTNENRSDIAKEQSPPTKEAWEWKRDAVVDALGTLNATIVALQEVEDRDVMLELVKLINQEYRTNYRVAFIDGFDMGTEQDVAILYQGGLVEYSRREQTREMFESKDYYNLSKHIFGKFEWQTSDGQTESLVLLNVHLRAKEEAADPRRKQAKLAHEWVTPYLKQRQNVIVLGDMNLESRFGEPLTSDDGIELLVGKTTSNTDDDMRDLNEFMAPDKRRSHMILDKEFDRILVSPSLIEDAPNAIDLVFSSVAVRPEVNIRGAGPDMDHWDTRYTKDVSERDISDHYPIVATFEFK